MFNMKSIEEMKCEATGEYIVARDTVERYKPSYEEVAGSFLAGNFDTDEARELGERIEISDDAEKRRDRAIGQSETYQAVLDLREQSELRDERDQPETVERKLNQGFIRSILGEAAPFIGDTPPAPLLDNNCINLITPNFESPTRPIESTKTYGLGKNEDPFILDTPLALSNRLDRIKDLRDKGFEESILPAKDYRPKNGMSIAEWVARARYPELYEELDRSKRLLTANIPLSLQPALEPIRCGDWVFTSDEGWTYAGKDTVDLYSIKLPKERFEPKNEDHFKRKEKDRRDGGL